MKMYRNRPIYWLFSSKKGAFQTIAYMHRMNPYTVELCIRYRSSQIKAAVKVNGEALCFYWSVGRDIVKRQAESKWGAGILKKLSTDLKRELPGIENFSPTNLLYMKNFYLLYSHFAPQLGEHFPVNIFLVPWGHHKLLIDKFKKDPERALFYAGKTVEYGWSRAMLLNFLDTDLYEREGKAITNFHGTLPEPMSDLAQAITKDPYNFAFAGIRRPN